MANNTDVKLNILQSSPYRLLIPKNVEHKIRYHINKFPHTEWSGFLFYDYEGSFEENNLVFKARDFVVLDIGSSGQTSFADCPKVCTYAIDHDLLDCKEALIHSHHSMGAFFSGTDDDAIKQEGMNCNHFLSLVVDTRGTYVARVTKRNVVKYTVHQTIVSETCYPTYEDNIICNSDKTEKTEDFVKEISEVIVYPLNIEVEKWEEENIAEWEADIKEARETAAANRSIAISNGVNQSSFDSQENNQIFNNGNYRTTFPVSQRAFDKDNSNLPFGQSSLFKEEDFESISTNRVEDKNTLDINSLSYKEIDEMLEKMISEEDIKFLAIQLLMGSPFVRHEKINSLAQYAIKLPTVVKERFGTDEVYFAFIDSLMENLLEEFNMTCIVDELQEDFSSYVAMSLQDEFNKLPKNVYVNHIIDQLNAYML